MTFVVGAIPFKDTPANDTVSMIFKTAVHPYAPDAIGRPVMTIDGKAYAQSCAILRYLRRIAA